MTKIFQITVAAIALSLTANNLIAGELTTPNIFVGGTPASASEVNANFSAIKTEVDDNDGRITTNADDISTNAINITANANAIASMSSSAIAAVQLKDNDGTVAGRILGISNQQYVSILTEEGYLTTIDRLSGSVTDADLFFFTGAGCTGSMYMTNQAKVGTVLLPYTAWDTATAAAAGYLAYIPEGTTLESMTAVSKISYSGTCEVVSASPPTQGYLAAQNDPIVTGISNNLFTTPMLFE